MLNGFNGQCLIEYAYRREGGKWKLIKYVVDSRLQADPLINQELLDIMTVHLPEIPGEQQPDILESLLLQVLERHWLDGGFVSKTLGGAYGVDGQSHTVTIEAKRRQNRALPGLATM